MSTAQTTRRELANVEDWIAWLTQELRRVEGQRDSLVRKLTDHEGCHDQRPTAVR